MSEQQQRRRRRRRRRSRGRGDAPAGESGATPVASDDASVVSDSDRSLGDRAKPARGKAKPNTIMGMPRTVFALTAGLFAALLLIIVVGQFTDTSTDLGGIDRFPDQGRRHLAAGETFEDYNSSPPTSGPQAALGMPAGVYGPDQEPPSDLEPSFATLLPVLERGGLVIYYDPAQFDSEADVLALVSGVERRVAQGVDLVLTTRSGLDAAVVATAWRHLVRFEEFDTDASEALTAFTAQAPDGYSGRFVLERQAEMATLTSAE